MKAAIFMRELKKKFLLTYAEKTMPQDWIFQDKYIRMNTSKSLKKWFSPKCELYKF